MKVKKIAKRLIAGSLIFVMLLLNFFSAFPVRALAQGNSNQAANVTNDATAISLNCISKNLKLGYKGADSYDFNVNGSKLLSGASYSWYIVTDKGVPVAVTINKKTGLVIAKKAGIAYICCKVTLEDGTILRPEAKVTVYNNITGVKINNLPEAMTIKAGYSTDFNRTITDTKAGKGKTTKGITRWEVTDDTSGVGEAEDLGIVFPTMEGEFTIRAVCFQNSLHYKLWKANKEKYGHYITATSEWHTITVAPSDGNALVSTNKQLDKALASDSFDTITLSTDNDEAFVIEQGDYLSKSLVVDAPNADVENFGTFKDIIIKAIKDTTWIEYADGNIIYLEDTQLSLVVDSDADIKQIVIDSPGSEINLEINGKVGSIHVLQPSKINLSGSASVIPVIIEETAKDSTISTSVSLDMTLHANTDITLNKGSEGTTIDKSKSSVEVKVDNKSNKYVAITTGNKPGAEIVSALSSGISNETTIPSQTPYHPSQPSDILATSIKLIPSNMVLSVSGSALSMFVAVTTPEYTSDIISWRSEDESIAIVDQYGEVTPVGLGTAHIIASTGNTNAVAQVTVVSGAAIHTDYSESGNLQSAGAFIATALAQGALEKVGSDLMGWGLKEAGLNFGNTTDDELRAMSAKLDQISKQISKLERQLADAVKEITLEVKRNEINTRIGQMNILISSIESIADNLNFLISNKTLTQRGREQKTQEIINQIERNLLSQENQIHNQLVGLGTQTSLLEVYSEAIKLSNSFLDTKDCEKVYDMYEYFEDIQTNMLILLVEYYHAIYDDPYDAKSEIDRLIESFLENIEEQKALLKPKMPEDYIFDTDNNIMIYTGYYSTSLFTKSGVKGPLRTTISNMPLLTSLMTYKYGYSDWRLLTHNELEMWFDKSNGNLYNYLVNSGWDNPNMNREYEIGLYRVSFILYAGINVGSGKLTTYVIPVPGIGHQVTSPQGDKVSDLKLYWIICRNYSNELNNFFY